MLEKALERIVALPENEQDAIASQILLALVDDDEWNKRFIGKCDVIRRMAQEALEEDERRETIPLDDLPGVAVPDAPTRLLRISAPAKPTKHPS